MKRHDPGYQFAQARIAAMSDQRFIQVNHLHPTNALHLAEFKIRRFGDVPASAGEAIRAESRRLVAEALGRQEVAPAVYLGFNVVLGSMIHDIGNLAGCFGPPERVVSTEIWADGRALSTVLQYSGDRRAICSWVDLPDLWDFDETLEVYGSRERVHVSFPSGFARGLPTQVTLLGMDDGLPWRKQYSWHDNPFKREIQHFRECILNGRQPSTPAAALFTTSRWCGTSSRPSRQVASRRVTRVEINQHGRREMTTGDWRLATGDHDWRLATGYSSRTERKAKAVASRAGRRRRCWSVRPVEAPRGARARRAGCKLWSASSRKKQ
jgi:hypothetical protein